MAPRAYWKGYLKLSLVSCPIALSPATSSSERISFRQINKQTGNRLRQQLVDEVTREPVDAADKGKGYEVDKGVYIEVDDDELEAIEVESKHTIEIDRLVPAAQIDKRYYDSPYYIMMLSWSVIWMVQVFAGPGTILTSFGSVGSVTSTMLQPYCHRWLM